MTTLSRHVRTAFASPFLLASLMAAAAASPAAFARGDAPCPCLGDLNADGGVDAADLAILLGEWGLEGPLGDLDFNALVDAADLAILLGAWGPCGEIPVNDACLTPISVAGFGVEVPFCTLDTNTSLSQTAGCGLAGNLQSDVFFSYIANETGHFRAKVYDATFDARAAIYDAPTPQSVCSAAQGGGELIGCTTSIIPPHIDKSGLGRYVEFDLVKGQRILVRVGSPTGAVGYGTLVVERVQAGWSPCEPLAFWTGGGGGTTQVGYFETEYPTAISTGCVNGAGLIEQWHTFESGCSQNFDLRISTCRGFTSMDCAIAVYVGPNCGELFEVDCADDTCVSDDGILTEEIVLLDCTPNTTYWIRLMQVPGAPLDQVGLQFQVLTPCP